jgi:hypothetical protein
VKVKVLVRVDVIERKPRRMKCFELSLNFRCDLSAGRRVHKYIDPETCHVVAETPLHVDEIRQARRWQDGPALDQHQMQPDTQSWQLTGTRDRILGCRTSDDKAGSG